MNSGGAEVDEERRLILEGVSEVAEGLLEVHRDAGIEIFLPVMLELHSAIIAARSVLLRSIKRRRK